MHVPPRLLLPLRQGLVGLLALAASVAAARLLTDGVSSMLGLGVSHATALRRVGVITALIAGTWLAARFYERRRALELRPGLVAGVAAMIAGAGTISLTTGYLYATGYYEVVGTRGLHGVPLVALGILAAAALEEFVFRGVLFRALEQGAGTVAALLAISIAFGALHLFNKGATPMTFLSVTLLGALWTGIFVLTRDLWTCTLHHAAWNLAIFWTGLPLSGLEAWRGLAPLESVAAGPALLTGGTFGPEDSIITVALLTIGVVVVLRLAGRRGRIRPQGLEQPASSERTRHEENKSDGR